ncbi:MAG: recombinase family protein [Actinobacteria bacterium]|nr:recombinase family protein [Actinomycetota bacterium]
MADDHELGSDRGRQLVEGHGEIVVEYFDVGQSRSLPWKRRPEAARLLDDVRSAHERDFDAVVIGEPARAFYGQQFGLTFPTLVHYGVELWVPEVGGRVDPDSEAHDLVMSLYGGMSKGERNRIKVRVRSAMASQAATEGRYLGGRPPYGYRLSDAGAHPNPAKAADGKRSHRLEPDPETAPVVRRIFAEYLDGRGLRSIAEGLTAEGIVSPSGHDPARNRHRQHSGGAWAATTTTAKPTTGAPSESSTHRGRASSIPAPSTSARTRSSRRSTSGSDGSSTRTTSTTPASCSPPPTKTTRTRPEQTAHEPRSPNATTASPSTAPLSRPVPTPKPSPAGRPT